MKLRVIWIAGLMLAATAGQLQAAFVLNHPPDGTAGYGWQSSINAQQLAQEFKFNTNTSITSVEWYGFFHANFPGQVNIGRFVVELFTDAGGLPSSVAAAGANTGVLTGIDTGLNNGFGNQIYKWSLTFPPIALTGGTTYWFGVKSPETNRPWYWSLATSDGSGDGVLRNTNSGSWFRSVGNTPGTDSQAFAFGGTSAAPVPEPASLAMWSLGGLGMMFARRKRQQKILRA